jgi:hypothetical protein
MTTMPPTPVVRLVRTKVNRLHGVWFLEPETEHCMKMRIHPITKPALESSRRPRATRLLSFAPSSSRGNT